MAHGWQFKAIDTDTSSEYYCNWIKQGYVEIFKNKTGDMKVICVEDKRVKI
jgi:hypothetical protein